MEAIIQSYLKGLELGDTSQILTLFNKEALVYSPLYGEKEASDFYKELWFLDKSRVLTKFEP